MATPEILEMRTLCQLKVFILKTYTTVRTRVDPHVMFNKCLACQNPSGINVLKIHRIKATKNQE